MMCYNSNPLPMLRVNIFRYKDILSFDSIECGLDLPVMSFSVSLNFR